MNKINFPTAVRNLRKNLLLLFSTGAALCLFLSPSITSLAMTGGVFIAICIAASYDLTKPKKAEWRLAAVCAVMIALLIGYMGYDTFHATWTPSSKVAALASALGITTPILLTVVGLLGCVAGCYSLWVLGQWITNISYALLKEKLPEQRKDVITANLKRNWLFPISAMAFLCLEIRFTVEYVVGLLIVFAAIVIISTQHVKIFNIIKEVNPLSKIFIILSTIGICWRGQSYSYATWEPSSKIQMVENILPFSLDIPMCISVFGAISAIPFVLISLTILYNEMQRIFIKHSPFRNTSKVELVIYGIGAVFTVCVAAWMFTKTGAFYGTDISCDLIYTSDSPMLIKNNVYLSLTYAENDLRQPLFAVFAAPFMGTPYLLGRIFSVSAPVQAILLNSVQILMLFTANFMLAKTMKLTSVNRICFMILSSLTYTHLLFVLMMEQYIVAYFWLIFCIYLICEQKQPNRIALWGAGGTLLTSMILLPTMSEKSPFKNFKEWFKDMVKYGLEFVTLMLVFGRFDVFHGLATKVSSLSNFTGKTVSLSDKVYQYTEFVKNCIFAPKAGIDMVSFKHISWQLNQATGISLVGVLILVLCLISAWANRNKKSSLLAVGWIGFSVIMLLGLGWGTKENGLILYALYFGWAFLVLLFQLVEKIGEKLNLRFLVPAVAVVCAVLLAVINIPAIAEMVQFAIQYYPA